MNKSKIEQPVLEFNQGVKNLPDCLKGEIKANGCNKVLIDRIFFDLGFDMFKDIKIIFSGESVETVRLTDKIKPDHFKDNPVIHIDLPLNFNGKSVCVEVVTEKNFRFRMNYNRY